MERVFNFKPNQFLVVKQTAKKFFSSESFMVLQQVPDHPIYGNSYELFDLKNLERITYPTLFAHDRLVVNEKIRS
jgi:hypothetical protein